MGLLASFPPISNQALDFILERIFQVTHDGLPLVSIFKPGEYALNKLVAWAFCARLKS